jgi:hypothetical protein
MPFNESFPHIKLSNTVIAIHPKTVNITKLHLVHRMYFGMTLRMNGNKKRQLREKTASWLNQHSWVSYGCKINCACREVSIMIPVLLMTLK